MIRPEVQAGSVQQEDELTDRPDAKFYVPRYSLGYIYIDI